MVQAQEIGQLTVQRLVRAGWARGAGVGAGAAALAEGAQTPPGLGTGRATHDDDPLVGVGHCNLELQHNQLRVGD